MAGAESFAKDPPNATVSAFDKEAATVKDAVVELTSPKMNGADLTFNVKVLEGDLNGRRRARRRCSSTSSACRARRCRSPALRAAPPGAAPSIIRITARRPGRRLASAAVGACGERLCITPMPRPMRIPPPSGLRLLSLSALLLKCGGRIDPSPLRRGGEVERAISGKEAARRVSKSASSTKVQDGQKGQDYEKDNAARAYGGHDANWRSESRSRAALSTYVGDANGFIDVTMLHLRPARQHLPGRRQRAHLLVQRLVQRPRPQALRRLQEGPGSRAPGDRILQGSIRRRT